jgi:hypothetical protein
MTAEQWAPPKEEYFTVVTMYIPPGKDFTAREMIVHTYGRFERRQQAIAQKQRILRSHESYDNPVPDGGRLVVSVVRML